jgi:hypothetical protein
MGLVSVGLATLLNARSAASSLSSASASRAASMKRLDCSGSSGFGFGLRPMSQHTTIHSLSKGSFNCIGSGILLGLRFTSCLIGEPLALGALNRNRFALSIVDTELGTSVLAEIELGQIYRSKCLSLMC